MHETGLAQEIIEILQDVMCEHQNQRLLTAHIDVGELVAVMPESLHLAYEALTSDTALQNSKLQLHILPILSCCRSCKKEFNVTSFQFGCPHCGSTELVVLSGNEFQITAIEIE